MKRLWIIAGFILFLFNAGVQNSWAKSTVHARQRHQQRRIAHGVRSGELTGKEVKHLEHGEAKIEKDREKALQDGHLSLKEREKLQHEENKESHKIFEAKHNELQQPSAKPN